MKIKVTKEGKGWLIETSDLVFQKSHNEIVVEPNPMREKSVKTVFIK